MKTICVTGGAGFIGSHIAIGVKKFFSDCRVIAVDNLKRRGSELNINRLCMYDVEFVHGDVRHAGDLESLGGLDWIIECSAEPSVHAGNQGSLDYLLATNLQGALNCFEAVRKSKGRILFLSSSRVYSIKNLLGLPLIINNNKFDIDPLQSGEGWSNLGIDENFSLQGFRSLYGSTKLSAEFFLQEYYASFGTPFVINRCGVVAGPWQMGKVDQGFVTLWIAKHVAKGNLDYIGFGGEGLQVRDILHVEDLVDLIILQMQNFSKIEGETFNVGGGPDNSVSLRMLTEKVQQLTQINLSIGCQPKTMHVDIPYYVTNHSKLSSILSWKPKRSLDNILQDTLTWFLQNEDLLHPIFNSK